MAGMVVMLSVMMSVTGCYMGDHILTLKQFKLKQSVTPFFCTKFDGKFNGDIYLELGHKGVHLLTWKQFKLKQSVTPIFHSKYDGKFNGAGGAQSRGQRPHSRSTELEGKAHRALNLKSYYVVQLN